MSLEGANATDLLDHASFDLVTSEILAPNVDPENPIRSERELENPHFAPPLPHPLRQVHRHSPKNLVSLLQHAPTFQKASHSLPLLDLLEVLRFLDANVVPPHQINLP